MRFPPPWVSLVLGPRADRADPADRAPGSDRPASHPLALAALGAALLTIATGGVRATLSAIAEGDTPTSIASGTLLLELSDAGDVDAAVAEGVVTPAELDAADAVIASGDVGEWFARAQVALEGDGG